MHRVPDESTSKAGACSIEGCERAAKYRATGRCQTHYHRWWRHVDPLYVTPIKERRSFQGDRIGYRAAHGRVWKARGAASAQACQCGAQASQWSYRGGCPKEKMQVMHRGGSRYECKFSPDPDRYDPLCLACHTKRDRWKQEV